MQHVRALVFALFAAGCATPAVNDGAVRCAGDCTPAAADLASSPVENADLARALPSADLALPATPADLAQALPPADMSTLPPPDLAQPPMCAHPICSTGTKLQASCDACATQICAKDSYCCNTNWNSICVGEVKSICGQTC